MAVLSKAAILAADDLKRDTVEVPEWGGDVLIKQWSIAAGETVAALWRSAADDPAALKGLREKIVQLSIIDPDTGTLMFSEDDLKELGARSAKALNRVYDAAMRLNGAKDEEAEPEKNG